MFFNESVIITSLYGVDFKPTPEQVKSRDEKIKAIIESMGDKYLLAKPVERKNGRP
jgi:hypothetical protein